MALVDTKKLPEELQIRLVTQPAFHSQRSFGGVALDWCYLAAGRVQVYIHARQMLWDYAAGLLIAHEAGCLSVGFDGEEIYSLSLDNRPAIGAVNAQLFEEWKAYLELPR